MSGRTLYSERQIVPVATFAWITLLANAALLVVAVVTHVSLARNWWVFLFATGCGLLWLGWVAIAYRASPTRLEPGWLRVPWRPPIALAQVEEARVVEGEELKRIRRRLSRGSVGVPAGVGAAAMPGVGAAGIAGANLALVLRLRKDPVLKGLVGTTGARSAIYLEVADGPTRRWLIGTRRPHEFLAALESGVASAKASAE